MEIKTELLKGYVADFICSRIEDFEIDESKIAEKRAIKILGEIQKIIKNEEFSDFDMVEEIINIFQKYKLDFGSAYDF